MLHGLFCQKSWDLLWFRMGALVPPSYLMIQRAYSEPHRHYHTSAHIDACLTHLNDHAYLAQDIDALEYAIWMHDVVYDTQRQDNEARSADLAASLLLSANANVDPQAVHALIMATKRHDSSLSDDTGLMCDIDLSVLALGRADYAAYVEAVRLEYHWVPALQFNQHRKAFLESLLVKESIYRHGRLIKLWENAARENIRDELLKLQ